MAEQEKQNTVDEEYEPETPEHRIDRVNQVKNEGNELVKQQKYKDALEAYTQGIKLLKVLIDGDSPSDKIRQLQNSLALNKALCCLKVGQYAEAIQLCDDVLQQDSTSAKALYRKALAQKAQGDLSEAKKNLVSAVWMKPQDTKIRSELDSVVKLLQDNQKQQQTKFSNMFERLSEMEEKEKKQKEKRDRKWKNEIEKRKHRKKRILTVMLILIVGIILAIISFYFFRQYKLSHKQSQSQTSKQASEILNQSELNHQTKEINSTVEYIEDEILIDEGPDEGGIPTDL
ncbi:MAG: hypothetical protein EZS28_007750 [Streblomastix strix]|uniref:peptidylprolyl isomerase n=1 Tax=Streblomastix strix TaxID=222440 RepID=A0A5J4WQL9_9EUKA|nr:MAG: hypothetical protein EZS28_007750 [Streblomastix strix]